MGEKAIEVTDLRYYYGKTRAVDGISFEVLPGQIMGFLGPNGAGKSTTIKMLTGMLMPQEGSAVLLGMDVKKKRKDIQQIIGICFEEKNLYLNMTAVENLKFFARLFGIKGYSPGEALNRVGLSDRHNERVKKYSKGMRQRLMMARALINDPDILFLDEPTDGLDPVSSRTIRSIIKEEAKRGAAVFLTTHDMNEADQLSNRVAFINEGRIVALDTPENLKLQYGTRSVKVRAKEGGETVERVVQLDASDVGDQLKQAVSTLDLMTIHTEEATLEDIFVKLTGRGLV